MTEVGVQVAVVPAAATFALRQRVLRPHQRVEDMGQPGDDDPTTVHLATLSDDGTVTGCLRLQPVPCPWLESVAPWQLRAMAVDDSLRGHGHGVALVREAVEQVAAAGGGLLWCKARVRAQGFYERAGFSAVTDVWEEPPIGPHVGMLREVRP